MNPRIVKNVFIAVLIFLPLQYAIVGIAGYYHSEPWPAFVFPGFKSVHVFGQGFEIGQTRFEVYRSEDDEPEVLQPQELFPAIPLSQIPGFMRTHFNDSEYIEHFSPEARHWLRMQTEEAAGFRPVKLEVVEIAEFYSHGPEGALKDSSAVLERTTIRFEPL
jgi:hypothetical protein